jgi:hypothetical protein
VDSPPPLRDGQGNLGFGGDWVFSSSSLVVRSITILAGRLFDLWMEPDRTEASRDDSGGVWVADVKVLVEVAVAGYEVLAKEAVRELIFWISTKSSSSAAADPER